MMSNYNTTFFLLPLLPFVFAAEYDVDDGFCYCYCCCMRRMHFFQSELYVCILLRQSAIFWNGTRRAVPCDDNDDDDDDNNTLILLYNILLY